MPVKVDQDIAAEDDVHVFTESEIAILKIQSAKPYDLPQLRDYPDKSLATVLTPKKIFLSQMNWNGAYLLLLIYATLCLPEHPCGNISPKDEKIDAAFRRSCRKLFQDHCKDQTNKQNTA